MTGDRPVLSGVLQVKEGTEYTKVGKIALWNSRATGAKAPKYTGTVTVDGKKVLVSLWAGDAVEEVTEEAKPKVVGKR